MFHTKISWDVEFSPIRDMQFVRVQTGEQAVTWQEYGEPMAGSICERLACNCGMTRRSIGMGRI